jgi:hypothetical protein
MFNINTYMDAILTSSIVDREIANYMGRYPNLFPQLNVWGAPNRTTRINLEKQNRVDVRWLEEHLITRPLEPWKSVTTWYIATVVLDNQYPIAILRATGNVQDMYNNLLFLNKKQHHYASGYLFSFIEADPGPELEPYDNIGAFSGDVQPHIRGLNAKYYNISNDKDKEYLEKVLDYTQKYNY